MHHEPDTKPISSRARVFMPALFSLFVGLFIGGVSVGSVEWVVLSQNPARTFAAQLWLTLTDRTSSVDTSQPAVVDRIRRLQRLETVVYTMDKIVMGAKESPIFPDFLAGDRLLMMVHGEVVTGIDFTDLRPDDVKVDGKKILLHLPTAQVFHTRIDSTKTRVYSRQTGLLVPTDPNLETRVRQEAEKQLEEAALADGILRTSQENAISTVASLLHGLGFEKIDFK